MTRKSSGRKLVAKGAKAGATEKAGGADLAGELAAERERAGKLEADLERARAEATAFRDEARQAETEWKGRFAETTRERDEFEMRVRDLEARLEAPEDEEDEEEEEILLAEVTTERRIPKNAREPARNAPMAFVNRGDFIFGEDEGSDVETPRQTVHLPSFWIDVYPVTNRQYEEYVRGASRPPPAHWSGKSPPEEVLDHPVVMVTWKDAQDFAHWAGKRLPTLQEWQKAARGIGLRHRGRSGTVYVDNVVVRALGD